MSLYSIIARFRWARNRYLFLFVLHLSLPRCFFIFVTINHFLVKTCSDHPRSRGDASLRYVAWLQCRNETRARSFLIQAGINHRDTIALTAITLFLASRYSTSVISLRAITAASRASLSCDVSRCPSPFLSRLDKTLSLHMCTSARIIWHAQDDVKSDIIVDTSLCRRTSNFISFGLHDFCFSRLKLKYLMTNVKIFMWNMIWSYLCNL